MVLVPFSEWGEECFWCRFFEVGTVQIYGASLGRAWERVRMGSPTAGIDRITVENFGAIVESELSQLQREMQQESYFPSPAKGFHLRKSGGGERLIGLATVRDRIVQRYLLQGLYPRLDRVYSPACHGYRPGHSIYTAVAQVREVYGSQSWVLRTDIQQFFDWIVWAVLLGQLEQLKIPDLALQWVEQHLRSGIVVGGQAMPRNAGVLQGSVLSGALANLYLSEFDRACWEEGIALVRYGDDCLVVCESWFQANRFLGRLDDRLGDLSLRLHPEKTQIFSPDQGFKFLGHQFEQGLIVPPRRGSLQETVTDAKPRRSSGRTGKPLVCGIQKVVAGKVESCSETYWSDPMTTLYVTDQGAYIRVRQKHFEVLLKSVVKLSVPVSRVSHVVLFGCCNLSHGAVQLALQRKIPVLYLASNGRYFGRLETEGQAQLEYLTRQVMRSLEPEFRVRMARSIILGKLHNSRVVLQRLNRKRPSEKAAHAIAELLEVMEQVRSAETIEVMMGYEGHGAALYFQAFATLLKGRFEFEKRTRRPPTDPVNSLMSLGYTLLSQQVHSMVMVTGLHTHFGNLHVPHRSRPSLVCDLVEEFRSPMVDSLVAYLINSNIFVEEDFTPPDERGGVYLHPDGLKKFLKHWEERLQTQVTHPSTGTKTTYRRCLELQVWEYVKCLTEDGKDYRPMLWTV